MNKRKICIIIVSILIIISLISVRMLFKNNRKEEMSKIDTTKDNSVTEENTVNEIVYNNENTAENHSNEVISDNTLSGNINTTIYNSKNKNSNVIQKKEQVIATSAKQETNAKKDIDTTSASTSSNPETSQAQKQSSKTSKVAVKGNDKVSSQASVQIKAVKDEKKDTPNPPSQNNKDIPKEEPKNEELYVRNDAMINTIKQIIESNATEDMKNFGYNIVIDSSIKGQTNQFTFTEQRVKSYIQNKFGTIRIYAEDYYKNGQLIMTECYII